MMSDYASQPCHLTLLVPQSRRPGWRSGPSRPFALYPPLYLHEKH